MDYRAMSALAANPAQVRRTANLVILRDGEALSENAADFLTKLTSYEGEKPLTTRELEFLSSLVEGSRKISRAGNYAASQLVARVYAERSSLQYWEEQREIEQLATSDPSALTVRQWKMLIALARQVDIIAADEWIELPGALAA